MNFAGNILAYITLAVLVLLSILVEKHEELKRERTRSYDLEDENYNLKKKIDDLKEDNKFLKEVVMEFKDGELTKGELIKSVQALIDDRENERLKKIAQEDKEL